MSSTGRAQLVDFGLAAVSGRSSDDDFGESVNPRTIDYAVLERATGVRKDDPRSDIYFAGCIFYHMLTGRAAVGGSQGSLAASEQDAFRIDHADRRAASRICPIAW